MVKTRSQTLNITIKKEEEEDCKPSLCLYSANNTTTNKITKRNLSAQQIKVEQDTDTKSLLQSGSKSSKSGKKQYISQEQINQLVHYIVNDNMSVTAAARKVNISYNTGCIYYNVYKNDPEKKIPVPRNQHLHPRKYYTQEQVENLIRYIDTDKMTLKEASAKTNVSYHSGYYHYSRYLKDPNHNIPVLRSHPYYTQDQRNEFIGYIINDKMSVKAASKKAKISHTTALNYYHNYFKVENPDIPTPSHIATPKFYTQEQKKEVIGYIVDDRMTIKAASKKANISRQSAIKYYHQYLNDNNIKNPVTKRTKAYTQDEINQFIGYIADDKMTIKAASKKASMSVNTASKYYCRYLKDHKLDLRPHKCAQAQINKLIGYIVDDKMTLKAASKKANMSAPTGIKYYHQYLKHHNLDSSIRKFITQGQKSELIGYIVHDKISITAASKKANMSNKSGRNYYQQYINAQKCDAST
jgi:transposase